jgi:regulator of cell morphogenesis and NO signaling
MNQTPSIVPTDTLAELAVTRAGASRAFARHGLDFCCHGQVSLAQACAKKGIEVDALIREVEAEERLDDSFARWDERPIPALIEHIVTRFHQPHRDELPRLGAMAARVEVVHGEKSTCPHGLATAIAQLTEELGQHMRKEEEVLFPMIVGGAGPAAAGPIQVMEQEHRDAAVLLDTIRGLTTDHSPPAEACGTWRALYLGLAEFERDLMQHVHLENYVLFPRALRS